jgi:signal transduction histidine kinase
VGQILEAGHHLLELINEVLDLSRIESGNMELRSLAVPVNDTILACISLSGPLAAQRGVQTLTILTETEGSFVMADKIRFRQILLNLISNGIKYNRENGNLEITARPTDNGMIRIEVSDTGPGLNDKQIDEVFEPFNRLNAANSQIEGTGIGLTITRRLTEMMDGTIEVKSQPGTGSTFSIELPVAEAPTSQS